MAEVSRQGKLETLLTWAVVAFFAVAIPYTVLNYKSGPVGSTQGIVLSTRGLQSDTAPTIQLVTVQLKSGETVIATTLPGVVASNGDVAFLHSSKRAISGAPAYEVYQIQRGQ